MHILVQLKTMTHTPYVGQAHASLHSSHFTHIIPVAESQPTLYPQ